MYDPAPDPTFNKALIRELRRQRKTCAGCRFNIQKPGDRYCSQGHWSWPQGPCINHEDDDSENT